MTSDYDTKPLTMLAAMKAAEFWLLLVAAIAAGICIARNDTEQCSQTTDVGHFLGSTSPKAFLRPDRRIARPSRTGSVKDAHLRAPRNFSGGLSLTEPSTMANFKARVEIP